MKHQEFEFDKSFKMRLFSSLRSVFLSERLNEAFRKKSKLFSDQELKKRKILLKSLNSKKIRRFEEIDKFFLSLLELETYLFIDTDLERFIDVFSSILEEVSDSEIRDFFRFSRSVRIIFGFIYAKDIFDSEIEKDFKRIKDLIPLKERISYMIEFFDFFQSLKEREEAEVDSAIEMASFFSQIKKLNSKMHEDDFNLESFLFQHVNDHERLLILEKHLDSNQIIEIEKDKFSLSKEEIQILRKKRICLKGIRELEVKNKLSSKRELILLLESIKKIFVDLDEIDSFTLKIFFKTSESSFSEILSLDIKKRFELSINFLPIKELIEFDTKRRFLSQAEAIEFFFQELKKDSELNQRFQKRLSQIISRKNFLNELTRSFLLENFVLFSRKVFSLLDEESEVKKTLFFSFIVSLALKEAEKKNSDSLFQRLKIQLLKNKELFKKKEVSFFEVFSFARFFLDSFDEEAEHELIEKLLSLFQEADFLEIVNFDDERNLVIVFFELSRLIKKRSIKVSDLTEKELYKIRVIDSFFSKKKLNLTKKKSKFSLSY